MRGKGGFDDFPFCCWIWKGFCLTFQDSFYPSEFSLPNEERWAFNRLAPAVFDCLHEEGLLYPEGAEAEGDGAQIWVGKQL